MATIVCQKHRPQMATVRQGVMHALDSESTRNGVMKVIDVEFKPEDVNVEIMEIVKEKHAVADITEAKIVVACGRGIGNQNALTL